MAPGAHLGTGATAIIVGTAKDSTDVAKEPTDGDRFGPLMVILETISVVYANHKVRLQHPQAVQDSHCINPPVGNRIHQQRDRKTHVIYRSTGTTFRNTSE